MTPTFFVDADYAWQFSNPVDHTIFPTTTAARLNLAYLGFELNGLDTKYGGPIGRVELQMGSYIATIHGQAMANLRKKLERDASAPRYLLTEPGVGYRLKA